jgi:photosystem II stability/assembly factor-like uncharacterized protein
MRTCHRGLASVVVVLVLALGTTPVHAQLDPAHFAAMEARSIGPSGMSGRIAAVDGVHADPNVIYAGAATGGLWKSTSGGVTWTPIMDHLPASSIGAIRIYQAAPDIVWVGTGERNRRNSAGVGTGVYKTMDGGHTWTHLGLENTGAIETILVHPHDPDVAYVAALGNTWADTEDRGVYKTTDGGATWQKILYVNERTGAGDLVMDPTNPNKLIAGMWEHRRWPWFFTSGGPGSGMHITFDGGATWRQLGPDEGLPEGEIGRIGMDFALSRPDVVYAGVEAERNALYRSDDGGLSWSMVNDSTGIMQRPFYYGQFRVDPQNENRVYDVHSPLDLSTDGGRTFTTLLPFERVHVDHHAFYINPLDGRFIVDGNDGGIYISRDRGESWQFVENLPLAQFYHINVDMETPFNVMGGLQDNGSWRGPSRVWHNGGIRYYHWQEVAFGDGFATIPDATNPRYLYAMSQGGNLRRSDLASGEWKMIKPQHPDGVFLRFNWNAGIGIDPFDGSVYYGSQFVHHTRDLGDTWTIISPDLTTNDPEKQQQLESGGLTYDVTQAENHTSILTIAPSPAEQGVIWVGTDDGNVQLTRDGGGSWANVVGRIRGVPANTWVPHIEPSAFDGGTAFVVFDDHRRGNNRPYVFMTSDYGRTWRSLVTDDIEDFNFVHVIEQDPVEPNLLFLGTEYGMYVSFTGGDHWMLWQHGLPRAPVRGLIVHPRDHDLVVGTHGRAAYVLDDVRPLRALAADLSITDRPLHLFPIPPVIQYWEGQVGGMRFLADAKYVGPNRPYGALISYSVTEAADDATATIEVLDADGAVVRSFQGPAATGINRTHWELEHDGFRQPTGDDTPATFLPPGPTAVPGTYTIRVTVGDHTVTGTVDVAPDPRLTIAPADRRAKLDMVMEIGRHQNLAADALDRLRRVERAVHAVAGQLQDRDDDTATALGDAGDALRARVTELRAVFDGREVQGIRRDPLTVMAQLRTAMGTATSTWESPTPTDRLVWQKAQDIILMGIGRVNAFLSDDVAEFRRLVDEADLTVFATLDPLRLPER